MIKNWIIGAALLALAGLTGGCGPQKPAINPDNGLYPKGRFVETEITVPKELQNNRYVDSLAYEHKLEILSYSKEQNQYFGYIYDGSQWHAEDLQIGTIADKITIKGMLKDGDNERYFYGYDQNRDFHILPQDQSRPEILQEQLSGLSSADSPVWIDNIEFQDNGSVLISLEDKAVLFSKDGEQLHEFAQDYNNGESRGSALLSDTAYVTVLDQKLVSYSLKDKTMRQLAGGQSFDVSSCIFSDREGSIYIANMEGLYHINDNSTIKEKIIDGSLNSMSLQSDHIRNLIINDQDSFFSVMNSRVSGNTSMFKYAYNPDISTLPQQTVTVYALNNSSTLRQAAALMQRNNPNVRVDIRVAMGEEYESMSQDIIRSLNTELLSGNGADILVLDGLPKEAYKEKGVLMNLEDLFGEMQSSSPLLSNVSKDYVDAQGAVYYLPVRFKMPVVFGEKSAVEKLSPGNHELPVLAADNYGNLGRLMLNVYYNQLFPSGGNELSEDGLMLYLEQVKKLGEAVRAKAAFTPSEMAAMEVDNQVSGFGNRRNGPVAFAQGKTQIGFENLSSIQDSLLTFGALEERQLKPESLDGIYHPNLLVGINQNTKNLDQAKEFLKVLYSYDIQNLDLSDGFPVLNAAVLNLEYIERDTKMEISDENGRPIISAAWPDKEKRIQIIKLIRSLGTPVDVDPDILNIITEYSQGYFDGSRDLETTAGLITNKIALYNGE